MKIVNDMTLDEILAALNAHDTGIEELSAENLKMVTALLLHKVDACRYRLDELEDEAKRHRGYAKEHSERAGVIEKQVSNLKSYITYAMQQSGFDKITGNEWRAALLKREAVEIIEDCTANDLANYGEELVRAKYEWNKNAIKDAINRGEQFNFATLTESYSPKFTPKGK